MYKKVSLGLLVVGLMLAIPFAKADVQDVSFRFCGETGNASFLEGKKTFFVTPGEETEICMDFSTSAEAQRKIVYGFTEGVLSPGGNQICDSDKTANNDFSKYFTNTEERSFLIQKDQPKTIKEKVMLPLGMSGVQYGCIAYSLAAFEGTGLGGMFNLIINKVFPISLFVGDSANVKSKLVLVKTTGGAYTTNNQIKATMDAENNLKLTFMVENQGNIAQTAQITGKIYNILGFEKTFSMELSNIAPGKKQEVVVDVGIVPFYKGFFTVKFNLANQPKFDFDTSNMDETMKQGGNIAGSGQIYIFSWITLAIILLALAIIIKLFWPRKKIIIKE